MKRQFDIGSENEQTSNDDTTTQIQIGWWPIWIMAAIILGIVLLVLIN